MTPSIDDDEQGGRTDCGPPTYGPATLAERTTSTAKSRTSQAPPVDQSVSTCGIASSRYHVQNARRAGTSVSSIDIQFRAWAAAPAQQ